MKRCHADWHWKTAKSSQTGSAKPSLNPHWTLSCTAVTLLLTVSRETIVSIEQKSSEIHLLCCCIVLRIGWSLWRHHIIIRNPRYRLAVFYYHSVVWIIVFCAFSSCTYLKFKKVSCLVYNDRYSDPTHPKSSVRHYVTTKDKSSSWKMPQLIFCI